MIKKKIFSIAICCILAQSAAFSSPAADIGAIPQAGVINTHDLNSIKELRREQQMTRDYKKYKENKKNNNTQSQKSKKEKQKVIKARAEEFATKGVYLENIKISPSQILTEEELQNIIEDYTETNVTFEQMKTIVDRINKLYLEKGFVTARAYLPEQTVEDGTIQIELIEGKVGNVTVTGNKWTKTRYITDRVQLAKGSLFNIGQLEENLLNFNRYNDCIEIQGNLNPGKEQTGTTDIELKAHEEIPFHMTMLFDNAGRSTIGKYRAGLMLQNDSLLGFRDRITLGAYANNHSVTPFADYNIPVNKKDGRVGFMFSSSNANIAHGPFRMFNIKSRSYIYSLYYNQPLIRKPYMELASTTSISYKQATTRFDGYDLSTDKISSAQTGINFRYDTKRGIWYLNQNVGYAFPIFDPDSNYFKMEGGFLRLHDFGHGVVGQLRGNYQIIPKHVVPYIDQFQVGGMATVRGYSEGLLLGRSGYLLSGELIVPILPRTIISRDKTKRIPFLGSFVKGVVFMDHAAVFPYKGEGPGGGGTDANDVLLSVGVGFRITLPGNLSARLSWGFPCIRNSHEQVHKWGRFHFELSLTPDFDKLVKLRHPKGEEKVQKLEDMKLAEENPYDELFSALKKDNKQPPQKTIIKAINKNKITMQTALK